MKYYRISKKNKIILNILYIIISLIISYKIQIHFKTLESLFCICVSNIYLYTLIHLFIEEAKTKR